MALQRIFRIDDTSPWPDKYGTGAAGSTTISSDTTIGSALGAYYGALTGTQGNYTATTSNLGNGTYNLPCLVWQTINGTYGFYEFNFLESVSSNTATFRYQLTNNYSSGAQIVTASPFTSLTLNTNVNLYPQNWNSSYGGVILLFASVGVTLNGNVQLNGRSPGSATNQADGGGMHGGQYVGVNTHTNGWAGEGYSGFGGEAYNNGNACNAINNAGAGGAYGSNPSGVGGGGGGSLQTQGTSGTTNGGGDYGRPGLTIGNIAETLLFLGAGGGSGAAGDNSDAGIGANGAGALVIVSPQITGSGNLYLVGGNGGAPTVGGASSGGGAGSGGSALFKTQILNFTGNIQAWGGNGYPNGNGAHGGNGGEGYLHTDYLVSATAPSATPTMDTRFDPILANNTGFLLLM